MTPLNAVKMLRDSSRFLTVPDGAPPGEASSARRERASSMCSALATHPAPARPMLSS